MSRARYLLLGFVAALGLGFTYSQSLQIIEMVQWEIWKWQIQKLGRVVVEPKPGVKRSEEIQALHDACAPNLCELWFAPGDYLIDDHDGDGVGLHKGAPAFVCMEGKHCEFHADEPYAPGTIGVLWYTDGTNPGGIHSRIENLMLFRSPDPGKRWDHGLVIQGPMDQFTIIRGNHFAGSVSSDLYSDGGCINCRISGNRFDSRAECPVRIRTPSAGYWGRGYLEDGTMDLTGTAGQARGAFCFESEGNFNAAWKIVSWRLEGTGPQNTAGLCAVHHEQANSSAFMAVDLDGVTAAWGCSAGCSTGQSIFCNQKLDGGTGGFIGKLSNSFIEHEHALAGDWRPSLLGMWPVSTNGPHNGISWWVDPRKSDAANAAQDPNL